MNERQWWATHVKPRLHVPTKGQLAWKQQDAYIVGRPDVLFNVAQDSGRLIGLMELKYDPAWPARVMTLVDVGLTAEQFRHLDQWERACNDPRTAVVLYGVGKDWWLLPHDTVVLTPGSKWTKQEIVSAAWFSGTGYASLTTLWSTLTSRPRFLGV